MANPRHRCHGPARWEEKPMASPMRTAERGEFALTDDILGQAKALDCRFLVGLPDRWRHTLAVADRAEEMADAVEPGDREILRAAARLHDVGYAAHTVDTRVPPTRRCQVPRQPAVAATALRPAETFSSCADPAVALIGASILAGILVAPINHAGSAAKALIDNNELRTVAELFIRRPNRPTARSPGGRFRAESPQALGGVHQRGDAEHRPRSRCGHGLRSDLWARCAATTTSRPPRSRSSGGQSGALALCTSSATKTDAGAVA